MIKLRHFGAQAWHGRHQCSSARLATGFEQFDNVSYPIFITSYEKPSDPSTQKIIYVNQAFLNLVKEKKEDWVGKTYFEKNPPELAEQYTRDDLAAMQKAPGEYLYKAERNESGDSGA